ncbi:40s ribosomal protein s5-1 [Hordeum vulgare]|nr:40s ribosomal protein s5-1 [Hordeum vulgare]
MASPKGPKDKIFEKVINPYLAGVLQHPQSIEMREGMLHIRDVEGAKKTRSVEARLEGMGQQVFKCQGMVERGLNANHMMITEFTNKHKIDANDIGKHLSRLYDIVDHLQAQIYDLQNQNWFLSHAATSIPSPSPSLSTTRAKGIDLLRHVRELRRSSPSRPYTCGPSNTSASTRDLPRAHSRGYFDKIGIATPP